MAKRSEMTPEEVEQYLASSNDDLDTRAPATAILQSWSRAPTATAPSR